MSYKDRRIVCSAPGRAGIIGNPTDMYGGSVISCSVGMRARVTVTTLGQDLVPSAVVLETNGQKCRVTSRDDLRPKGEIGRAHV